MFPREEFNCIDKGVLEAVVSINRIPDVFTNTTCEGHVWRKYPVWPTKNGWIYFNFPEEKYKDLVEKIEKFCTEKGFFSLEKCRSSNGYRKYTINANFEPHHNSPCKDIFSKMSDEEKEAYLQRAEIRKEKILAGWKEFNDILINYVMENISRDIEKLPYMD